MKRLTTVLLCSILTAFLLFSCGKGGAAAASELVVSNGAEPTLDPSLITDIASTVAGFGLFEGLMQYSPTTNEPVPALALSYAVSADGTTVTFKLRRAQWSDGHPVTAGDFVYAMQRILDPKTAAPYAYLPSMVIKNAAAFNAGTLTDFHSVGISAVDDRTLRFELMAPTPYFIAITCHSSFWPIPRWAVEQYGNDWTKPGKLVSNGPFTLAEWEPQDHILLVRNPRYWNSSKVRLSRVRLLSSGDDASNYKAYKSGAIDWMRGTDQELMDEVQLRPDYQHAAQIATSYYVFNVKRAPLDRPDVRRALAMAIDKRTLAEKVLKGGLIATNAMVPPMAGYEVRKGLANDPDAARKLLASAGYPGGKGFPALTLLYEDRGDEKAVAEYVQQQWKEGLGISVRLANQETKAFLDRVTVRHDFDISSLGWGGDYLDPSTMLDLFESGTPNDVPQYSDANFDALVRRARAASGPGRMSVLEQAEDILLDDAPIVPIYHFANQNMIELAKWGGWNPTPLDYHPWQYLYRK